MVVEWRDKHPRLHIHFTPTPTSWLNMVERFFRDITTEPPWGIHQCTGSHRRYS
jgi:hypothetical protein